jgi:hypothetical protein
VPNLHQLHSCAIAIQALANLSPACIRVKKESSNFNVCLQRYLCSQNSNMLALKSMIQMGWRHAIRSKFHFLAENPPDKGGIIINRSSEEAQKSEGNLGEGDQNPKRVSDKPFSGVEKIHWIFHWLPVAKCMRYYAILCDIIILNIN